MWGPGINLWNQPAVLLRAHEEEYKNTTFSLVNFLQHFLSINSNVIYSIMALYIIIYKFKVIIKYVHYGAKCQL